MLAIAPTLEHALVERAEASGLTTDELLAQLLAFDLPPLPPHSGSPLEARTETPEETRERVQGLLAKWQAETGFVPLPGGSKTITQLFAEWEAEDADLTDEEREADRLLQEDINRSLEANRGLRI